MLQHATFKFFSAFQRHLYDIYIHRKQPISFQDQHWNTVKFNPSDMTESKHVKSEFENYIMVLNENAALNQSLS
jgi:hypothetical protein